MSRQSPMKINCLKNLNDRFSQMNFNLRMENFSLGRKGGALRSVIIEFEEKSLHFNQLFKIKLVGGLLSIGRVTLCNRFFFFNFCILELFDSPVFWVFGLNSCFGRSLKLFNAGDGRFLVREYWLPISLMNSTA